MKLHLIKFYKGLTSYWSKWRDLLEQISKDKIILVILVICFSSWLISIRHIGINELDVTAFGPFQYLSLSFWTILFIAVYLNLISIKPYLKTLSILLISLMMFGTLSIILPYGPGQPDAYAIMSFSKLIFKFGNIDYGFPYIISYPSSFIFNGVFQEVIGISVRDAIRNFPLITMILYISSITVFISMICKYFNINNWDKFCIIDLAVLFFATFMLSLGARIDPVPQTLGVILLPFFLASNIHAGANWRIISLIFLAAIISTHMMTSFISILLIISLFFFLNIRSLQRAIVPCVLTLSWTCYIGIIQLRFGLDFAQRLFELENGLDAIALKVTGFGVSGAEMYLFIRKLTIIFISILLLISYIYLYIKRQKIAILYMVLFICMSPLLLFWFLKGSEFISRIVEFSVLFLCMILALGIHEILASPKNVISLRYEGLWINKKGLLGNYQKTLSLLIVIMIIITCFLSALTVRHSDMVIGYTGTQIKGNEFIVSNSDEAILSYQPLAIEYTDYSSIVERCTRMGGHFKGIVGISQQWKNRQKVVEKNETNSITLLENKLNIANRVTKAYDNGNFAAFQTNSITL